jgi:hypothetical protein
MQLRTALLWGGSGAALIAAYLIIDGLVVTEQERLEEFSTAVTGMIDTQRIDKALTYTDPARQPIEVTVRATSHSFDATNPGDLQALAYSSLAPFSGERLTLLQRSIQIKGESATVTLDTLSKRGRSTVDYDLRKTGDNWIVRRVHVR